MGKNYTQLTKSTAYPIIARYFQENVPIADFCLKEGLSRDRFSFWRKRYLDDHPSASSDTKPASFHPIQVTLPVSPVRKEQNQQIELEYPNGVILRIAASLSDVRIASLIKLY